MIRYMIMRDLRQFSLIYLIFTTAFAQCIFFVNHDTNREDQQRRPPSGGSLEFLQRLLRDYAKLWMDLFKMTLGVYDLEPYRNSYLARVFLLLFIYLIPILFNM